MPIPSLNLERVKVELDTWRSQQKGAKRIPEHLWDKALKLLKTHSPSQLNRELGLDYSRLKKHYLSSISTSGKSSKPKPMFLEVKAKHISSTAKVSTSPSISQMQGDDLSNSIILSQANQSCRILIERNDGSRLTIDLAIDWPKIEAICRDFLRA